MDISLTVPTDVSKFSLLRPLSYLQLYKNSDLYIWLQKASYDNKTHLENSFSTLIKW